MELRNYRIGIVGLLALTLGGLACSSSSEPVHSTPDSSLVVNGSVKGSALTPQSAYVVEFNLDGNQTGDANSVTEVIISDVPGSCAARQQGNAQAHGTTLAFSFAGPLQGLQVGGKYAVGGGALDGNQVLDGNQTATQDGNQTDLLQNTNQTTAGQDANHVVGTMTAGFEVLDGSCNASSNGTVGLHGVLMLGDVSAQGVSGAFDLIATTGDHLHGHFEAPSCEVGNGNTTGCQ